MVTLYPGSFGSGRSSNLHRNTYIIQVKAYRQGSELLLTTGLINKQPRAFLPHLYPSVTVSQIEKGLGETFGAMLSD